VITAFQSSAFQRNAFQIAANAAASEDRGQTPAGRKRRWLVTVEGKDYFVDSVETARELIEAHRKVVPLPIKRKRTTRVVTLPEVRLEGLPPLKVDGVSVATIIRENRMPEVDLRAILEALDEEDIEILLMAA
jgi:hypothetical protein